MKAVHDFLFNRIYGDQEHHANYIIENFITMLISTLDTLDDDLPILKVIECEQGEYATYMIDLEKMLYSCFTTDNKDDLAHEIFFIGDLIRKILININPIDTLKRYSFGDTPDWWDIYLPSDESLTTRPIKKVRVDIVRHLP